MLKDFNPINVIFKCLALGLAVGIVIAFVVGVLIVATLLAPS